MILEKWIVSELQEMSSISGKDYQSLYQFGVDCYFLLDKGYYDTQFESYRMRINHLIIDFVRDYALFDDDNSSLLKDVLHV